MSESSKEKYSVIEKGGKLVSWGKILATQAEKKLIGLPDGLFPIDGQWQNVIGTPHKFYVFSAFFDGRDNHNNIVRIIGATKVKGRESVWCRFWYTNETGHESISVTARIQNIRENWNLKYSAVFVICPLHGLASRVPEYVSVVYQLKEPPSNLLKIRNTVSDADFKDRSVIENIPHKLGVCVKPMHYEFNKIMNLIEFIELHSIMGVEHFTFYNHTVGSQVSCILSYYKNQAAIDELEPRVTIDILPWDLDMVSQVEIRTEGLFAALNDCLYRNMYRFVKFLAYSLIN